MSEPGEVSIEVRDARIDVDDVAVCERLSFRASGRRVVIAGPVASAVAAAIGARGAVTSGSFRIDGLEVSRAEHFGHVGIAPIDLPLPHRDSVLAFVTVSFRLSGLGRSEAAAAAHAALAELGLDRLAPRRASSLSLPERRAVAIAQAVFPHARVLFAEMPLCSLEPDEARPVLQVLAQASARLTVVATTNRTDPSSPERDLLLGADCAAILSATGSHWIGQPDSLLHGARIFALAVQGDPGTLAQKLADAGVEVHGQPPRFSVRLPEGATTAAILRAACESGATLTDILPLWD